VAWTIEEGESQWGGKGGTAATAAWTMEGGEGQSTESIVEVNLVFVLSITNHKTMNF